MPDNCLHKDFIVDAKVYRLTETGDSDKIIGYSCEIKVKCKHCELPFEWIGLPYGMNPSMPTVSLDNLELRARIKPTIDTFNINPNFSAIDN